MAEIEDQRDDLVKRLMGRRYDVDRLRAYYEGDHPLPWAPKEVRDAYLALMRMARSNWCRLIVQAPAERLRVLGLRFSTEPGPGQLSDTEVWRRIWQGNRMDLQSRQLHTTALWGRRSFALVWPRADGQAPAITAEHPAQVLVDYAPGDRSRRIAAVKVFVDQSSGRQYCTVWTPEGVWNWYRPWSNAVPAGGQLSMTGSNQLVSPSGTSLQGKWLPWADPAENIEPEAANPTGEVPVFEFVAHPEMMGEPLGELDGGVTDVQDRINRTVLDRLVTSNFASFPQRYATGLEVPKDDQGNDVEPFKTSVTRLWQAEDPMVKFGQFPVADLANYLNSVEADIQHLAATTRTPPHYLLGQALALDTEVPTPSGMTTMGRLAVGDVVYDERGQVRTVEEAFPVLLGEPCYRLSFDDGTEVVADADHRWVTNHYTKDRAGADVPRESTVVTTREIVDTLRVRGGRGMSAHHFIPTTAPVDGPDRDLPVDPYVLGVWLGNGDARCGSITEHIDDANEVADLLRDCGERVDIVNDGKPTTRRLVVRRPSAGHCGRGHVRTPGAKNCVTCERQRHTGNLGEPTNIGLTRRLAALGVLHNKHIPEAYQLASAKQRLALLQGLMDTDGTVRAGSGAVEFNQSNAVLVADTARLIRSLGHKSTVRIKKPAGRRIVMGQECDCKTAFRLYWSAPEAVFRLERKWIRQAVATPDGHGLSAGPFRRYIVDAQRVPSVPVRCVRVSGPSHQFLVTASFIATHNSGAFPSGDSLKATETGLVAKTLEIRDAFSEVHEDMLRFALRLDEDPRADDVAMSLVWQNPESRSDAEMMDAATKLSAIGFPFRDVAAYLGRSPEEIERLENERAEDAALNLVVPPLPPAPMPTLALPAASAPGAGPRPAPFAPGSGPSS